MQKDIYAILKIVIAGNTIANYLTSLLYFFIVLKALSIFKKATLSKLEYLASKTNTKFDDIIINRLKNIKSYQYWIIAIYIATKNLIIPKYLYDLISYLLLIVITYNVILLLEDLFNNWISDISQKQYEKSLNTIQIIFRIIIWIIAILFLLHNFGVKIGAILTGLGIGGVAIALASQTILGDIFNFFVIIIDKPFKIGDFIILPSSNLSGTIEAIGLKSVKIRTLRGELLIITNSKIISETIANFSTMKERRVVLTIQIVYETPLEKLKLIPQIIKEAIESINEVRFERANIINLNTYSIDFELIYYVNSSDYNFYVYTNEKVIIEILSRFKENNINLAYPLQRIRIEGDRK